MTTSAQITRWLSRNALIHSEYGLITAQEWCEIEKSRIPNSWIEAGVGDQICLMRSGLSKDSVNGEYTHNWEE